MSASHDDLRSLIGTRWKGRAELWLDPLANEALWSDCTFEIREGVVTYAWSYEGKPQSGSYELHAEGVSWQDTWHQPSKMSCNNDRAWGLFSVFGTYGAPSGPDWGWRTVLSLRPTGELVLQMTNVAPWGEEQRAVRMVCSREQG